MDADRETNQRQAQGTVRTVVRRGRKEAGPAEEKGDSTSVQRTYSLQGGPQSAFGSSVGFSWRRAAVNFTLANAPSRPLSLQRKASYTVRRPRPE